MTSSPIIYFRAIDPDTEELDAARKHFPLYLFRTDIPRGSLVIPRYTYLPFPEELHADATNLGCRLINSLAEHKYVGDIRNYLPDLGDLTPRTWTNWANLPEGMSFVLKGITNSRKFEWSKRMFAATREDVPRVASSLLDDALIKDQGLVVREYIPLKRFGVGLNGLPITNEWRVFILDGEVLSSGFYWANEPDLQPYAKLPNPAVELVDEVARRVGSKIRFYVVDVAETASGDWIVIELNDGCMSGLSTIDPDEFYHRLKQKLTPKKEFKGEF